MSLNCSLIFFLRNYYPLQEGLLILFFKPKISIMEKVDWKNINLILKRISEKKGYRISDITLHYVTPDIICWTGANDENWDDEYINPRYFKPEELDIEIEKEISQEYFPFDIDGDAMRTHRTYITAFNLEGKILKAEGTKIWDLADPIPEGFFITRRPYERDERVA